MAQQAIVVASKVTILIHQIRVYPYYYPEKFCFPAQIFAAKERKEHKEKKFSLRSLCSLAAIVFGCGVSRAVCIRG